jgi:hypothetical protein
MSLLACASAQAPGGALTPCTVATIQAHVNSMQATCCTGSECDAGLPQTCSARCAPVFTQFWRDCGAYLEYMPGTDSFSAFDALCEAADNSAGSQVQACDVGDLLTLVVFSCSAVDMTNPTGFCDTDCSHDIAQYVARCGAAAGVAGTAVLTQAQGWLASCSTDAETAACHASTCDGPNEHECSRADDRAQCHALTAADSSVFCSWHSCDGSIHGAPPPPALPGCKDTSASNYDPHATVSDGSCLYGGGPVVNPCHATGTCTPCSVQSPWACDDASSCEQQYVLDAAGQPTSAHLQWVTCAMTGDTSPSCRDQCTAPCTPHEPQNCYTAAECLAVGDCQQPGLPASAASAQCANRTTQWYQSSPPSHTRGRCERGCSVSSRYTCRTQATCAAIGMQWLNGRQYPDMAQPGPGTCSTPCSATSEYSCHTRAACEGVGMQWVPTSCCGSGCTPPALGQEAGTCQEPCSTDRFYSCHDQPSCEAVGHTWTSHPSTSACGTIGPQGSCGAPCTTDHHYNCKSQASCDAIGLVWTPAVNRTMSSGHTYMQPGQCSYGCSLMQPTSCNTRHDCEQVRIVCVCGGGGGVCHPLDVTDD